MSNKPAIRHKSGFRGPSPDVGKATQFQPGVSGNATGRPKQKPWLDEIKKWMASHPEDVTSAVRQAFKKAKGGSLAHLRELIDRIDGPVQQSIEVAGLSSLVDILLEREDETKT